MIRQRLPVHASQRLLNPFLINIAHLPLFLSLLLLHLFSIIIFVFFCFAFYPPDSAIYSLSYFSANNFCLPLLSSFFFFYSTFFKPSLYSKMEQTMYSTIPARQMMQQRSNPSYQSRSFKSYQPSCTPAFTAVQGMQTEPVTRSQQQARSSYRGKNTSRTSSRRHNISRHTSRPSTCNTTEKTETYCLKPDIVDCFSAVAVGNTDAFHYESPYDVMRPERNQFIEKSPLMALVRSDQESINSPSQKGVTAIEYGRPIYNGGSLYSCAVDIFGNVYERDAESSNEQMHYNLNHDQVSYKKKKKKKIPPCIWHSF